MDRKEITQLKYLDSMKSLQKFIKSRTLALLNSHNLSVLEAINLLYNPDNIFSNEIIGDLVELLNQKEVRLYD